MGELKKILRSFRYAIRGIGYGIWTQRNMRIHLVALATIIIFNCMAELSVTHWCIELLCCMLVISLELVNTALEAVCDQISIDHHPLLGHAKDAAAGAVLVSAIGSVIVALLIFFGGGPYRDHVLEVLRIHSWIKCALSLGALVSVLFVFLPSILQKK